MTFSTKRRPLFRRPYLLICFCSLTLGAAFFQAAVKATPETLAGTIRVGLQAPSGKSTVTVTLTGPAEIVGIGAEMEFIPIAPRSFTFTLQGKEIACDSLSLRSIGGVRLIPQDDRPIQIGQRFYRGTLEITKEGNKLTVIQEPDLEDYVFGALLFEGGAFMPRESLKALAVAIRTYGVRSRRKHSKGLYDVCDTTHCQGYVGLRETKSEWARIAQQESAGQILTWEKEPIWAAYSTDCGGATSNSEDGGFGQVPWPYLRGRADTKDGKTDNCSTSSAHQWTKEIPVSRLETLLNKQKATQIGRLRGLAVESADTHGRAVTIRLEGEPTSLTQRPAPKTNSSSKTRRPLSKTNPPSKASRTKDVVQKASANSDSAFALAAAPSSPPMAAVAPAPIVRTLKATALRSMIGVNELKSTFFTVEMAPDRLIFRGRGYGHGVGMCIAGASGMARTGSTHTEILSHYYGGATLVHLYEPLPDEASEIFGEDN